MGFLDVLKKLVPKSEPMPWDARSVRHLVVYTATMRPESPQRPAQVVQLTVRSSVPVSSGALGAERLETLRGVVRKVEWN